MLLCTLPAAAFTSALPLSEVALVDLLVQRFGHFLTTRKPPFSRATQLKRRGPILVQHSVVLKDFGEYLALAGYEAALDELITALLQLQDSFTTLGRNSFESEVQLLRLAGAPGTGKTTFASVAFDLVLPRVQQVQQHDSVLWAAWESQYDPQQLLQRLEASWGGQQGPLVFIMDMSYKGKWLVLAARHPCHLGREPSFGARLLSFQLFACFHNC